MWPLDIEAEVLRIYFYCFGTPAGIPSHLVQSTATLSALQKVVARTMFARTLVLLTVAVANEIARITGAACKHEDYRAPVSSQSVNFGGASRSSQVWSAERRL